MNGQYRHPEALVETGWLADNLDSPGIVVIDASFYLPAANRDPKAEFFELHIPGSRFFDIDEIADKSSFLPHMLPPADEFSNHMGKLGIENHHHVIAYDGSGGPMAAMRAWWTMRVYGHEKVSVLNGGLPKWLAEGRATEGGPVYFDQTEYRAEKNERMVRSLDDVLAASSGGGETIVDARAAGRFTGADPEPRAGMRSGHIPGSLNLPFQQLLDMDSHMTVRSADELLKNIKAAGIDPERPVVSSCGSGVTAAVLVFSLHLLGYENAAIYDGSWTEWGGREDTPIET